MSNTVGYGVGAGVGLATEAAYGTAEASADVWLPFSAEAIKANRAVVPTATIYGDRSRRRNMAGLKTGAGDINMEVDGANIGYPLFLFTGTASGGVASAALAGYVTSAPTVTPSAGGSLTAGAYRYRVSSVWSGPNGELWICPASASATGTTASSDLTNGVAWTNPSGLTPPDGFTYAGTIVWRSAAGGAANSEKFLTYVSGSGASYSNNSTTPAINTSYVYYTASPYLHTFKRAFTPGTNPLPGFTAFVVKDNDYTQAFKGCRMNTFELAVGDGNSPVQSKFGFMARDFEKIANPSITISDLRKFMSWRGQVAIDGTYSDVVSKITIKGTNNCVMIPGLSGQARYRDVGYGLRAIGGSFDRAFENHDFFTIMEAGSRFDVRLYADGQGFAEGTTYVLPAAISGAAAAMYPLNYSMFVDCYNCSLSDAGANASGPGPMTESINFETETDDSEGTELKIRLINLTTSYS